MKILIISQWYKPVKSAASNRLSKIAQSLRLAGHQVEVLTGMPNYPTGILPEKYKGKLYFREKIDNINILRTYELPAENCGTTKRLLNNISFMLSGLCYSLFTNFDLVIASSPPFLDGIIGLGAALQKKTKFIFDVRDLWPDSAIELGYVRPKWLIWCLKRLEKKYYSRANHILTATPSISQHLISEGVDDRKISVLLNSVDTNLFKPEKIDRQKYGFTQDDFIVAYTGNLGAAQGLETTMKAALILKKYPKIKFLFVGEGEKKEELKKLASSSQNIIFWDEVEPAEVVKIINFSDCGNISLAKEPIFQQAIPSKTLEYFACQKPVIAAVGGDLANIINQHQAGIIYDATNPESLAKAVLKLANDRKLSQKMGQNARKLVLDQFSLAIFQKTIINQVAHLF